MIIGDSSMREERASSHPDKADEENTRKCEHFSIRGYVSEARMKNWKVCWPFSVDEDGNSSDDSSAMLPPLVVPKFKFWRCESCLNGMGIEVGSRSTTIRIKIFSLCREAKTSDTSGGKVNINLSSNDQLACESEKLPISSGKVFMVFETGDDRSAKSMDIVRGKKDQGLINDDSNSLPFRKRARKVHLLTELLCGNTVKTVNDLRSHKFHSEVSAEDEKLSTEAQSGNGKRGLGIFKKRKLQDDEEWKPVEKNINRVRKSYLKRKNDGGVSNAAAITEDLVNPFSQTSLFGKNFPLTEVRHDGTPMMHTDNLMNETDPIQARNFESETVREMNLFPLSVPSLESEHSCSTKTLKNLTHDTLLDDTLNLSLNSSMTSQDFNANSSQQLSDRRKFSAKCQDSTSKFPVFRNNSELRFVGNMENCSSVFSKGIHMGDKRPTPHFRNFTTPFKVLHEHGGGDFPIEIVELMAQNQYERDLPDSDYCKPMMEFPSTTQSTSMIDFSKGQEGKHVCFLTGRNGAIADPTKHNPLDFFPLNDLNRVKSNHQDQAYSSVGFLPLNPSSFQTSGIGYSRCSSRFSHHNSGKQKKYSKQVWSSVLANHMQLINEFPQLCPSTNSQSRFSDDFTPMFFNQSHTKNQVFDVSTSSRVNDSSSHQQGVYSNDSIPAMHLLSLMDAGASSSTKNLKRPPNDLPHMASPYLSSSDVQNPRSLGVLIGPNQHDRSSKKPVTTGNKISNFQRSAYGSTPSAALNLEELSSQSNQLQNGRTD